MKLTVVKKLIFKLFLGLIMVVVQIPLSPARAQMSHTMFMPLPGCLASTTVLDYTGGQQTYVVPTGCEKIRVKMWGAGGGGAYYSAAHLNYGGAGAFVTATVDVTSGETLNIIVGGGGGRGLYQGVDDGQATNAGGYGGGGNGGDSTQSGAGGGGYSGVFRGGWAQANALVIAGGGGGSSAYYLYLGGGVPGSISQSCYTNGSYLACYSAGSALQGGAGEASGWGGGGGGGGYTGGGGGNRAAINGIGGGAGSSYGGGAGVTKFIVANGVSATPAATTDVNYSSPLGQGGQASPPTGGQNGRVVIVTETSTCVPQSFVYSYTGGNQNLTVPAGCYSAMIKAWGAGGGAGNASNGGSGAFVTSSSAFVVPGESLIIQVGGGGGPQPDTTNVGGWPGGGGGGNNGNRSGGGGGGYSGVFRSSVSQANAIVVAGGGGGGLYSSAAVGVSGSMVAPTNCHSSGGWVVCDIAGTALAGATATNTTSGGGGGGYVGGGASSATAYIGGGGGSSFGGTIVSGDSANPPGTLDPDYAAGVAIPGISDTSVLVNTDAAGGNGRVVITFGSVCTLPWGSCTEGQTVTGYSVTSATHPTLCVNNSLASTCQEDTSMNPSLTPTYVNQTCTQYCNRPWGGTTAAPGTITAFSSATATYPTLCNDLDEVRACQYSTGTFSGTFTNQTCTQYCNIPWGGTTSTSVTAYSNANAYYPTTCAGISQSRSCTYATGLLTGTYTNQSCTQNCSTRMGQACTYYETFWAGSPRSGCFNQCGNSDPWYFDAMLTPAYWSDANCQSAWGIPGCASAQFGGYYCVADVRCKRDLSGTYDCFDNCN